MTRELNARRIGTGDLGVEIVGDSDVDQIDVFAGDEIPF